MLFLLSIESNSQNVNWSSLKSEEKHIANIHAGFDYGIVIVLMNVSIKI